MERLLDLRDDAPTALARSKLQAASAKYNELLSRIEAANIELEVTRASFKYQYTIVKPPELARKPSKPNVTLVMVATLLLALILMVLVPAGLDLWRGRFVESWQVESRLNLPLLGELIEERE
jgi:capsular polysaccharide biosynthesis protein